MNRCSALLILFACIVGAPKVTWGQTVVAPVKLDNFMQNVKRDPLKETMNTMNLMKNDYDNQQLSIDEEAADILKTLRNPFIPQLPQKEIILPVTPTPQPPRILPTPVAQPSLAPQATITPIPTKPEFKISGLIWDTDKPQAIVNDKIVTIGDTVELWLISNITREGVQVESSGYKYLLKP